MYPKRNEQLYKEVAESGGAVITEFPFGMQPMPSKFPIRNRIISGISDGILVIEAQEKSGTLITAGHAGGQGKDIFAVHGNIDSLYSNGTNALIKDGAKITTCIEDIVEEIYELKDRVHKNDNKLKFENFTDEEIKTIDLLKTGEKNIIEIQKNADMDIGEILSILTILEMKGTVKQMQEKILF